MSLKQKKIKDGQFVGVLFWKIAPTPHSPIPFCVCFEIFLVLLVFCFCCFLVLFFPFDSVTETKFRLTHTQTYTYTYFLLNICAFISFHFHFFACLIFHPFPFLPLSSIDFKIHLWKDKNYSNQLVHKSSKLVRSNDSITWQNDATDLSLVQPLRTQVIILLLS